ncbi:MAG: hypothetical protein OCU18_00765 [Candidatus Syntrophoarchaeum sp.]|nr:hypothetical protein [Candidatus Syntrophoarchaeum sp.]
MNIITSLLFFLVYAVMVALIITYISSRVGAALMFFIPIIGIITIPEQSLKFFSFELFAGVNGAISICNIHVLLAVWAGFLSVIVYTEFLSWYLEYTGRIDEEGENTENEE